MWNKTFRNETYEYLKAKLSDHKTSAGHIHVATYQQPSFLLKQHVCSAAPSCMLKNETPSWNWLLWSDLKHNGTSFYEAKKRSQMMQLALQLFK